MQWNFLQNYMYGKISDHFAFMIYTFGNNLNIYVLKTHY